MNLTVQFWERVVFGIIVLGGYVLAMGTLAFFPIPEDNRELFSQGIGALGTAVGVIVAAIWKNGPSEQQAQNIIADLAAKTPAHPPAGTTTVAVTPPAEVSVTTLDDDGALNG